MGPIDYWCNANKLVSVQLVYLLLTTQDQARGFVVQSDLAQVPRRKGKCMLAAMGDESKDFMVEDSGPPTDLWVPSEGSMEHARFYDDFLPEDCALALRSTFDEKFENPREGHSNRFVWDWWHVPGQYTLLRTPAERYFGEELYQEFLHSLGSFGQEALGCAAVSPPWISMYVDGCEQRLHTDAWHGPWAYVYSLTDWENRKFSGGETMILTPNTLDYWRDFSSKEGLEEKSFVTEIEPFFNRLTIFDPRFPHGVREVKGNKDPLGARIVIHGWFTDPSPFIDGGLDEEVATTALNECLEPMYEQLQTIGRAIGVLTVRITIDGKSGNVKSALLLSNTLVPDPADFDPNDTEDTVDAVERVVYEALASAGTFPPAPGGEDTAITVPFIFE